MMKKRVEAEAKSMKKQVARGKREVGDAEGGKE